MCARTIEGNTSIDGYGDIGREPIWGSLSLTEEEAETA